jgi:hypothetical protein
MILRPSMSSPERGVPRLEVELLVDDLFEGDADVVKVFDDAGLAALDRLEQRLEAPPLRRARLHAGERGLPHHGKGLRRRLLRCHRSLPFVDRALHSRRLENFSRRLE